MFNQNIIYFDNGATTFKPKILSEKISDYYNNYSANKFSTSNDVGSTTKLISTFSPVNLS